MNQRQTGVALGMAAACVLMLAGGCARDVGFREHSPYTSAVRYDSPLVVVVPDGIDLVYSEVRVGGGGPIPRRFHVYYGQALRHESRARFRRMFREVYVIEESRFARVTGKLPPEEIAGEESGAAKAGERPPEEPKTGKRKGRAPTEADMLPEFVAHDEGYALHLREPLYKFENGQSFVVMEMEFRDRFLDVTLTQGRIRGRGSSVSPRQDDLMVIKGLQESVTSAFSALFLHMRDRMIASIEEPKTIGGR